MSHLDHTSLDYYITFAIMSTSVAYLEHANITVPSIDAAIEFLLLVEPEFKVRHDETPAGSYRWAHIGTHTSYIALQEPHLDAGDNNSRRPYKDFGVNHLAFVVPDVDAASARLDAAGFSRSIPARTEPSRKRAYFYDRAGFEWELVQYLTDVMEERNAY